MTITMNDTPKSLLAAVRYFSDPKTCFEAMLTAKWPTGEVVCPKCGSDKVGVIRSRSLLQCKAKDCRKQFSVKVGTVFEDSPLGLDKWFVVLFMLANDIQVSQVKMAEALDVTQKTIWSMRFKLQLAIRIAKCKRSNTAPLKASRRTALVATGLSGRGGEKAPVQRRTVGGS